MSLDEQKEFISVPKDALFFYSAQLTVAIRYLEEKTGISFERWNEMLSEEALHYSQNLSPEEEAAVIKAWSEPIGERTNDLN